MVPITVRAAVTAAAPCSLGRAPSATMAMMKTNVSPRPTTMMAPAADRTSRALAARSVVAGRGLGSVSFAGMLFLLLPLDGADLRAPLVGLGCRRGLGLPAHRDGRP